MLAIKRLVGISIIIAGFVFLILVTVVNPLTAKTDASCDDRNVGGLGGSPMCGIKHGGILPDLFIEFEPIFVVLSLSSVAFGTGVFLLHK